MKKLILKSVILLTTVVALSSFDLPSYWFIAGSKPKSYEVSLDKGAGLDGKDVNTIRSIDKKIDGFGTLMQVDKAEQYLGKRIKMSGFVKSNNVANWSGLWLRVDISGSQECLLLDNMNNRPIKGTTAWTKYEIVLDVPNDATQLAYGALLDGTGQIWFDKISFDIVDNNVPVTAISKNSKIKNAPTNPNLNK